MIALDENHWIQDWLASRAESPNTVKNYTRAITEFITFCQKNEVNFSHIVEDYRTAKYAGAKQEQILIDSLNDIISSFQAHLKKKFAPLTVSNKLTALRSFFKKYKIGVDVDLPKRACVTYHNRDLTKEIIRAILAKGSPRNRTMWLMLAECGMRPETLTRIRYWQIKKDFEAGIVPMQILFPASEIKDCVGDVWSFIGEDGFRELKEYLKPRLPLKDQDFVFTSNKPGCVTGEQFTENSLSVMFMKAARLLGYNQGIQKGKPGHVRMYGLRKFFRNNMKAEESYREFWMGHSIGTDAHYISRDVEEHRKRYADGYEQLRIYETAAPAKKEIEELKAKNGELTQKMAELQKDHELFSSMIQILRDPKKLKLFENWLSVADEPDP